MAKDLKPGDKVGWDSSGAHSTGKVVKKQTTPTQIKGHKVAASKGDPQFIVRSEEVRQNGCSQSKRSEEEVGAMKRLS